MYSVDNSCPVANEGSKVMPTLRKGAATRSFLCVSYLNAMQPALRQVPLRRGLDKRDISVRSRGCRVRLCRSRIGQSRVEEAVQQCQGGNASFLPQLGTSECCWAGHLPRLKASCRTAVAPVVAVIARGTDHQHLDRARPKAS